MMVDLGNFSLAAAWLLSLYSLLVGVSAARLKRREFIESARRGLYGQALFAGVALTVLTIAFLSHDFRYLYVWQHSNRAMPAMYLFSAVWGGMDGSLLLWATLATFFAAAAVSRVPFGTRDLFAWAVPMLSAGNCFFLSVVLFLTNPFRQVPNPEVIIDGRGLNPLLQNPTMLIHPPSLYFGFTGFAIPAAFALAALCSGDRQGNWLKVSRRWTLIAWAFLTLGIILGGNWAYVELGWGGFWAWDPVENSSFLPWLTGTAFLHSVMVQEQKGMLKAWNISLAMLTYLLTVFGTFLTRSGVVQSVHAFAEGDVGWVFLLYLGLGFFVTLVLMIWNRELLRPERRIESFFSREAAFLLNNLLFLAICFATFWGVMFPVFSEWISGTKSVVGPPFFNRVNVPLFLLLLFLMSVGPLLGWRRASWTSLRRTFAVPLVGCSIVSLLLFVFDRSRPMTAIAFGLCLLALWTISAEFRRAKKARQLARPTAQREGFVALVRQKPRRYAGMFVHLGIALMAMAMTASMAYKIEKDVSLKVGEEVTVGHYRLFLDSLEEIERSNHLALVAAFTVREKESGNVLGTLRPERRFYASNGETTTEVDMRITPRDDLYLALSGIDATGVKDVNHAVLALKVFVNPLQMWLWVGALMVLFSSVVLVVLSGGVGTPALAGQRIDRQVMPVRS